MCRMLVNYGWSSGDQRDGHSVSMKNMIHRIPAVCLDFPLARRLRFACALSMGIELH
jgi:hypothetical protein